MSDGILSWLLHLQLPYPGMWNSPLSILAEQTACGQLTTCSGSAGRVFVQDAPRLIFPRLPSASHNRKEAEATARGSGRVQTLQLQPVAGASEASRVCSGAQMQPDVCTAGLRAYLTTPDVFLRTEAAKLWVTPTRLVPSTSTIWSFTLILKAALISLIIPRSLTSTTAEQPDGRQTKQLIVSH